MNFLSMCIASCIFMLPMYFAMSIFDEFNRPRWQFKHRKWVAALILCVLMLIPMPLHNSFARVFFRYGLFLVVVVVFYEWKPLRILLAFCAYMLLVSLTEGLTMYLFLPFIAQIEQIIAVGTLEFLAYNLICALIMSGVFLLFLKVRHVIGDRHSRILWVQIILIVFLLVIASFIVYIRTTHVRSVFCGSYAGTPLTNWLFYSNTTRLLITILFFASLPTLFVVLHQFIREIRKSKEVELIHRRLQLEMDKTVQWQRETLMLRQIRHDLKNHIAVIESLGRSGELPRQRQYIDEVLGIMDTKEYEIK